MHVRGCIGIHGYERVYILAKGATLLPFILNISKPHPHRKSFYFWEIVKEWNSKCLASEKEGWLKRFLPMITLDKIFPP